VVTLYCVGILIFTMVSSTGLLDPVRGPLGGDPLGGDPLGGDPDTNGLDAIPLGRL
jgi:hypothetical protein